jgi:hypothetical protein
MPKKLIIPKENFSAPDIFDPNYYIRFRIITDDKNKFSYWSPIFGIDPDVDFVPSYYDSSIIPPAQSYQEGQMFIEKHQKYGAAIWNEESIEKYGVKIATVPYYDVWVRWGASQSVGSWEYKERISSTSLNILRPANLTSTGYLSVEIYRPSRQTIRRKTFDVYQNSTYINLTTDVITFSNGHEFKTGDGVTYESIDPVGGLTNNGQYFAREINSNSITLHSTQAGAINNTGKINITSNKNATGFFTYTGCPICGYLAYAQYNFAI